MGILPKEDILRLYQQEGLLSNVDKDCFKSASYDLRCGNIYYCPESPKSLWKQNNFHELKEGDYFHIPPYQIAFLEMEERVKIPSNLTGKLGLRNSLLFRGIILGSQTQIDPGYEGPIWCMLHNTSDKPVKLKYLEHVLTIDFREIAKGKDAESYCDKYGKKVNNLRDALPDHTLTSGLADLSSRLNRLTRYFRTFVAAVFSILCIIVSAVAMIAGFGPRNVTEKELLNAEKMVLMQANEATDKKIREALNDDILSQKRLEDKVRFIINEELKKYKK